MESTIREVWIRTYHQKSMKQTERYHDYDIMGNDLAITTELVGVKMQSLSLVVNCINTIVLVLDEHLSNVDHMPEYGRILFNKRPRGDLHPFPLLNERKIVLEE